MDAEIENRVKRCHACQENLNSPAKAPVHPWEWPEHAWSRVHIDYAGPFEGSMFWIVTDAYSNWMEVISVRHATSQTTIDKLRILFATHGLPEMLVSETACHSPVLSFRNLSAGMLSVTFSLLRIIVLPTDSLKDLFKFSSQP